MGDMVIGVDPSLRRTGLAAVEPRGDAAPRILELRVLRGELPRRAGLARRTARLSELRGGLRAFLDAWPPSLAAVEGYAFHPTASRGHAIAEWGGVLRLELADRGIPFFLVPPPSLRLYASGVGGGRRAPKDLVGHANSLLGAEIPGREDDLADALFLAAIAAGWDDGAAHRAGSAAALRERGAL